MATTLIKRTHTFLLKKIVASPKKHNQIKRNWQFTLLNKKINLYGEKRNPLGDMNKLAESCVVSGGHLKILYTSNISPDDLTLLTETLKVWGPNLIITQEPLTKVDINKLLISAKK